MTPTITLRTFDLPTLHRNAVGFDRIFEELDRVFTSSNRDGNYPPHNIVQIDDTHYIIEVAVAGFKENELDVEVKDSVLTVKGEQTKKENEATYLHRGIGSRNFVKRMPLAENIEVRAATVENGILSVALELVIPEEKKPRKIALTVKK